MASEGDRGCQCLWRLYPQHSLYSWEHEEYCPLFSRATYKLKFGLYPEEELKRVDKRSNRAHKQA